MAAPPKATSKKAPAVPDKKKSASSGTKAAKKSSFLFLDPVGVDIVPNAEMESNRHARMLSFAFTQGIASLVLAVMLVCLAPFLQPIYYYYARNPAGQTMPLDALIMPNMTNRAVLSWCVTSVTEIMTIGFGDLITQLGNQKPRFTDEGWTSFVKAFHQQRIGESFKENRLVLTTVPSNTAVILAQGPNEDGVYQWKVQVPVIMTFATNNNVSQSRHGLIDLSIVRVRSDQNPSGIAIKLWHVND